MAEHLLDLGPAFDLQQDVAAGAHEGQRLIGFARPTARTMSMREMIVPKSLAAQRTKAKTLPGRKDRHGGGDRGSVRALRGRT
jgi:hypothetical protein